LADLVELQYRGCGLNTTVVPHLDENCQLLDIFMLFFLMCISYNVVGNKPLPAPLWDRMSTVTQNVKMEELYHFLVFTLWTGHNQRHCIRDFRSV
jgi:hypothetical protein